MGISDAYDLLVVYVDGTEKIIHNVNGYEVHNSKELFVVNKGGYRHFLPMCNVRFIGVAENYYD